MRALRLRVWLVLLLVLASTFTFIIVGAAILLFRLPQIEQNGRLQAHATAETMARLTEQFLVSVEEQIGPLAELAVRLPAAPLQAYLEATVGDGATFDAITVVDGAGRVRAAALPRSRRAATQDLLSADLSANRLFVAAQSRAVPDGKDRNAVWSDRYLSPLGGQVTVGMAFRANGTTIIGELSRRRLLDLMAGFGQAGGAVVIVLDSFGQFLGATNPDYAVPHFNFGAQPTFRAIVAGQPLPPYETNPSGQRVLPGGVLSPRLGWVFGASVPAGLDNPGYRATVSMVLLGFAGSVFIALLLAPLWARGMERPIRGLIEYADRIAAVDYDDARPRPGHVVELNQLGFDLDLMARAIREREESLRALNAELEERVAQRTEELSQANDELGATVDNLKATQEYLVQAEKLAALGHLVAGIAHELNTPIGNGLMAVSTLADLQAEFNKALAAGLRRSDLDRFAAGVATACDIAIRNMNRATDLISSFKQVAVDQTSAQRRRFKLDEVVHEIVLTLQPTLKHKPCRIETEIPADLELDSYPGALGQVIANLIDNAVLHGFEGRDQGIIRIEAASLPNDSLRLVVRDDGRGIPADRQKHIFEPFYTTRMGLGGSGLGLHIVHSIATNILGGTIAVDSQEGQGAAFVLLLPRRAPDRPLSEAE